ncbi:acyltransferase family protein [Myceligenerans crystallogenes]|uniref:Acyltransferase family protein n=1 Tax=Myceligenerans crystallogenes TaxID=316335 RepID=A0ABN2NA08_9MICO
MALDIASRPPAAPGTVRTDRSRGRIEEIHGLRGIALALVAAFHLFGNGRVSGGVDVFLVLSGFLATRSHLGRVTRGDLRLVEYYGRTFLRLVLPALVVLAACWVLTLLVAPEMSWHQTGREIIASALYYLNWEMISGQLAYGAAGPEASPLQHFWSLSVQGQFFLAWPLVILAFGALAGRAGSRATRVLAAAVVGLATVASFAFAVQLSRANQPEAYFHTGARFWELGAGALLAIVLPRVRMPAPVAGFLAAAGLALVVSCGFVIDGGAVFPGPLALWPVAGALLVVLGSVSERPTLVRRALNLRPVTFVADISYGLYLWHWVLLVAFLQWRQHETISVPDAALLLGVAGVLAWATHKALDPLHAAAVRRSRATPLIAAVAAVGLVAGGSYAGLQAVDRAQAAEQARIDELVSGGEHPCLGAAVLDPAKRPCEAPELEGVMVPAVATLDTDQHSVEGCWSNKERPVELRICTVGPATGYDRHLFAVGDSHNHALAGAYQWIAERYNWRIDVAGRAGCHWNSRSRLAAGTELAGLCDQWNQQVTEHLRAIPELDAIIATHSARTSVQNAPGEGDDRIVALANGLAEQWALRPSGATRIIALKDVPVFEYSATRYWSEVVPCVTEAGPGKAAAACSRPRADVVAGDGLREAARRDPNAVFVDATDLYCGPETCSPVIGHAIVYRDGFHLTGVYARSVAPYLGELFADALSGEPGRVVEHRWG